MAEAVRVCVADAAHRGDPTGTAGLRRAFRAAGKLRLRQLRAQMRIAVMEHDVLGFGGPVVSGSLAYQSAEVRMRAFAGWMFAAAGQILDGPWLSWWVGKAWASGELAGARQTGSALGPSQGSGALLELARAELQGIVAALIQAIMREAARSVVKKAPKRQMVWRRLARAFDKIGPPRISALANTITVMGHNHGKLAAYRAAGFTRVGVIAEHVNVSRTHADALTTHVKGCQLSDAKRKPEKHKGYQELGPARPEWELAEVEEPIEIGVRTARDPFVCMECDEFAASSPHSIDEVEDTLPIHPNCLPGNSLVLSRHRIAAVSERFYEGDLAVLRTASGRELACTPNHPVLTDHGWVAAGLVDVGCNVVCDRIVERTVVADAHDQYVPTRIEDVAAAFRKTALARAVPVAAPDFHGDGVDGEVAVIWTDSKLGRGGDAPVRQHGAQAIFQRRSVKDNLLARLRSTQLHVKRVLLAATHFLGLGNLSGAFVGGHALPFDRFLLRLGPTPDAVNVQNLRDHLASGDVAGGQFEDGIARLVSSDDMFLDSVVSKETRCFQGHVYNLQTDSEYYTAEGVIVHNCRCTWFPWDDQRFKRDAFDPKDSLFEWADYNIYHLGAGSPQGGQFASAPGEGSGAAGGGTHGGKAAPATPKKKLFEASANVTEHRQRVSDVLNKPALRNDNYRYIVGKLAQEAQGHGTNYLIKHPDADGDVLSTKAAIKALKNKIGESFWHQGELVIKKLDGPSPKAIAMLAKGKSMGYVPPHEAEQAVALLMAKPAATEAPKKTVEEQEAPKYPIGSLAAKLAAKQEAVEATIPVAKPAWTKIGPQAGSVAGGVYGDPQGNSWYVKTPKTEEHVNADLLANRLYKWAGVPVSDEVKTELDGKSAVASKLIQGVKPMGELSAAAQLKVKAILQQNFAVDAWLGNWDVIGLAKDNILATESGGAVSRIDHGGALMFRAQGEKKPFGTKVTEIDSMRDPDLNPQTYAVFGAMTYPEIVASIDKVLAIPEQTIMHEAKVHGLPGLAATLIARREHLKDIQAEMMGMKYTLEAEATPAELEKAKKTGPFYPAPQTAAGQKIVEPFNLKWATTAATDPQQLEQKVAEYKITKAKLEKVQQEEMTAIEKTAAKQKAEHAAQVAAELKAAKAKAAEQQAAHKAAVAKIAAELGVNPEDAEQVDTFISLAGGNPETLLQQFKVFQKSGEGKHGYPVSPFEAAMIQSYVGPHAYAANAKLRDGVWDTKTHVFANTIQTALGKLKPYNSIIKRGFTADTAVQETYKPGAIIMWHGFSSCGKSGSFGGNMQCTIKPLSGDKTRARDLGLFNPSETGGEVLMKAHTPVKVISVSGKPGGTMNVVLEEVEAVY